MNFDVDVRHIDKRSVELNITRKLISNELVDVVRIAPELKADYIFILLHEVTGFAHAVELHRCNRLTFHGRPTSLFVAVVWNKKSRRELIFVRDRRTIIGVTAIKDLVAITADVSVKRHRTSIIKFILSQSRSIVHPLLPQQGEFCFLCFH